MPRSFEEIAEASVRLGDQQIIMPIDEIQLAHEFASLPNIDQVIARLLSEIFDHRNMHVRRIAVNATRHAKTFDVKGLREALTLRLRDPEPWVRYDAAWAIDEAGYDTLEIRHLLTREARQWNPDDEALLKQSPGNAAIQARVRAKRALDRLEGQSSR